MLELNKIYCGDSLEVLKAFPNDSIDCVVTSPPYYALRDYGVSGQIGLEKTFQEYINKLLDLFDEVKRVLRPTGTCWVNLGDTYFGGGRNSGNKSGHIYKQHTQPASFVEMKWNDNFLDKTLMQIPSRFSIGMTDRGWILRNELIWYKPNCMPSSVKDRFTVDFEKIFFFVKNKKYWFETQYEGFESTDKTYKSQNAKQGVYSISNGLNRAGGNMQIGRNKRAVWRVTTKPYKEAHFATYPEALIETPIKAGCPENGIVLDPFFGSGTTGLVALKQNKNFIGIELNPEYIKLAEKRLKPYLEQTKLAV